MARYRRNWVKLPPELKNLNIYERIRELERRYPEREIEARKYAERVNIKYKSYEELMNDKISKKTRYRTALKVLGLLTGKYQSNRGKYYSEGLYDRIKIFNEDLAERYKKAFNSNNRDEINRKIGNIGYLYITRKENGTPSGAESCI